MELNPWLDFAMRGEADLAFPQFLEALAGKISFSEVGNLIYRDRGEILENPMMPLVEDLDTVPFPKGTCFRGLTKRRCSA